MNAVIIAMPERESAPERHSFLSATKLAEARIYAASLAREDALPADAAMIHRLVDDIEAYREAMKGAAVIVGHAGEMLKRQDAEIAGANHLNRETSRALTFTQLKCTTLYLAAVKLLLAVDLEIEQRREGGRAEDWAQLAALAEEMRGAIALVSR